jgi:hypothetical protein
MNGTRPVVNIFVYADITVKEMKAECKKNSGKKSGDLLVPNTVLQHKGPGPFIECFYFIGKTQSC